MVDTRASTETRKRFEWNATPESVVQNLLIINSVRSEDGADAHAQRGRSLTFISRECDEVSMNVVRTWRGLGEYRRVHFADTAN
jgi:hypothetical protein